jgi:hypothetical protein
MNYLYSLIEYFFPSEERVYEVNGEHVFEVDGKVECENVIVNPVHPFFQRNIEYTKIHIIDRQNRYLNLQEIFTDYDNTQIKNNLPPGSWLESMPIQNYMICLKSISETVITRLRERELIVSSTDHQHSYDPKNIRYKKLYKVKGIVPVLPKLEQYDTIKVNLNFPIDEEEIKIQRRLRDGDAYCDIKGCTKIKSTFYRNYNFGDPSQYSVENPLYENCYNIFTFTFPDKIARYSMLFYRNDKRIRLAKERRYSSLIHEGEGGYITLNRY